MIDSNDFNGNEVEIVLIRPNQIRMFACFLFCFLVLQWPALVCGEQSTEQPSAENTTQSSPVEPSNVQKNPPDSTGSPPQQQAENPPASNFPSMYGSQYMVIKLKYLKPDQVKMMLVSLIPNGRVKVDVINSMLVAQGGEDDCAQLKALLAQLDVPPRQVMFEAQAFEVSRDDLKNIGIDWGSMTALPSSIPQAEGSAFRVEVRNHPGYFVNVSATINRLVENKKGRLLASPRIAALDGQTARILIGDKLCVESTQINSGVTSYNVTYIDVGIKLEVTPTVNDDGTITTVIRPEVSNKTDETKNGNPNIRTRQAETTLRVKNGETIVLGGLIQHQETSDVFKVPLLGDIPWVGQFFKTTKKQKIDNELIIMITPKILN